MRKRLAPTAWLLGAALLVFGSGCRVAAARVWNLREVHETNGRPRYRARTQNDATYLLQRALQALPLGEGEATKPTEKPIKDPLGTCFSNLNALAECDDAKDLDAALMAEGFAWLAVDCTYSLSRERAARALGPLALRLKLDKAQEPPAEPASVADIGRVYETLVTACVPIVRGEGGSALDVRDACEAIGEIQPDRAGTLRLLRASNVLLEEGGKKSALDSLRGLQRSLAKRAVAFALFEAMGDEDGRVVAACLESRLMLPDEDGEGLIQWALSSPPQGIKHFEDLAVRAVDWIGANGLPRRSTEANEANPMTEEERLERWTQAFVLMFTEVQEGPMVPAISRALSRLTGRPESLRPEDWLSWWNWERDASRPERSQGETPERSRGETTEGERS